jgi:hypothetical protein
VRRDKFISELEGLVHPIGGRKHTFVMFKAYLDESGIHHQAHSCVVAGYSGGGAAGSGLTAVGGVCLISMEPLNFTLKDFGVIKREEMESVLLLTTSGLKISV